MITTNRNVMIGAHTTNSVKAALQAEAQREHVSVSRLIHNIVIRELRKRGYMVEDEVR